MARIKPGVLGEPSGKVGDVVYRRKSKKLFSYKTATKRKRTLTKEVIRNESIFAKVTKFSNFVNKPEIVKEVWNFSKLPGTYSNLKIFKYNYIYISTGGITKDVRILPPNYFYSNEGIRLVKDKLTINFYLLNPADYYKKQSAGFKPPYYFIALVYAKDPVSRKTKENELLVFPVESINNIDVQMNTKYSFTFKTPKNAFSFVEKYNTVLVFPAIVSVNYSNSSYEWAECGGVYIKGKYPSEILYKPKPPKKISGKQFFVMKN